jgi:hypothetical protein
LGEEYRSWSSSLWISLLIYRHHNNTRFTIGLWRHVSTHMSHLQANLRTSEFLSREILGSQKFL